MKILLDECVTKRLASFFAPHEVVTVTQMKWKGLKNGQLLLKAIEAGFDIILTIDKNIDSQQNIGKNNITIVIFDSPSSKIEVLKNYVPEFKKQALSMSKSRTYIIRL